MTLSLIGLGLGDEKDITVRGLELVKSADLVFLEAYTSLLSAKKEALEAFYGKKIILADRDLIEKEIEEKILIPAKTQNVALLVVGDTFGATTHTDLVLRAKEMGVEVEIVHNASIMNAVGVVGLELYKFGKTTSIPYWEKSFEPEVFYDVISENKERGLHTLCLLDIKADEERFMTVQESLELLKKVEEKRVSGLITSDLFVIGLARIGQADQDIFAGSLSDVLKHDFGDPLHCLIVPGELQVVEEEALRHWQS
ncbi:diphthine synthase [Candidatus Woesearchaeota archaeon]|nr:diphthine synthase [Candidatus Woesearchaeota archaeon]